MGAYLFKFARVVDKTLFTSPGIFCLRRRLWTCLHNDSNDEIVARYKPLLLTN